MSSFVKFTVLQGAHDQGPLCYLLEIDEAKLLLDCGWTETLDMAQLSALEKVARQVDAVLLTHADLDHIGAFPYASQHLGLSCSVFATTPVHDMGSACMHDFVQSKLDQEEFVLFSHEDVDNAFKKTTVLRYSQPSSLTAQVTLLVVPYGRSKDTEEIVYAVDYNHRKERHLNGTVLLNTDALIRPTLLITDSLNILTPDPTPRKQRDAALIESIATVLSEQGNVLIPSDSTTRVLELLYMLDQHWAYHRFSFHLCLRILHSMAELDALSGPKVVLASFPSLMTGFAHELFLQWCASPKHMVILPDRAQPGTLGRQLFDDWLDSAKDADMNVRHHINLNRDIPITLKRRIPLVGDELAEFLAKKQADTELARQLLQRQRVLEEDDDDSDMSEVEEDTKMQAMQFDIYVKDVNRSTGFFKQAQAFRMYPVHEYRPRVDDYGEIIDADQYAKLESLQVPDEIGAISSTIQESAAAVVVPVKQDVPSKYIQEDTVLTLRCRMQYIDFEGRSDGKSVKNIISQVAPRKLLLVHGDHASTKALTEYCKSSETLTREVLDPVAGVCVNVSSATNLFQVVLTDSLVNSLNMKQCSNTIRFIVLQMDDYNLTFVTGVIKIHESLTGGSRAMLEVVPVDQQLSQGSDGSRRSQAFAILFFEPSVSFPAATYSLLCATTPPFFPFPNMSGGDVMDMALDEIITQKRKATRGQGRRRGGGGAGSGGNTRTSAGASRNNTTADTADSSRSVASYADKLVVSNLAFNVTESDVRELFSRIEYGSSGKSDLEQEGVSLCLLDAVDFSAATQSLAVRRSFLEIKSTQLYNHTSMPCEHFLPSLQTKHTPTSILLHSGPLRSAQLNYNSEGKSKGAATVVFSKHGDAARACTEYNNRTLDERPMKIELIVNPDAPALRLGPSNGGGLGRNTGAGGVSKSRTPARSSAPGKRDGAAAGGGRGRRGPKKPVTAADLDAEMDLYIATPAPDATQLANALA
ncbi:hypothetical protein BSLG_000060 [Batrachochytrium salamandrivorans]|nr:hypothetical protein BSLG_000060 [Batrachochytrium salamandrivorans]